MNEFLINLAGGIFGLIQLDLFVYIFALGVSLSALYLIKTLIWGK